MKRSATAAQLAFPSQWEEAKKRRRISSQKRGGTSSVASKGYVNKKVKSAKWSKQMVAVTDFDTATAPGSLYPLTKIIVNAALANEKSIFCQGSQELSNDGDITWNLRIKIDAIKWQLRYALGETEATDANTQTIREIFFRTDQQYQVVDNPSNIFRPEDDLDGAIKYTDLYGGVKGLYSDRMYYLMSLASDSDTTSGGQAISKGFQRLNYVDTLECPNAATDSTGVRSEKGQLALCIDCDNPTGTNANAYGYVEVHWRFLKS